MNTLLNTKMNAIKVGCRNSVLVLALIMASIPGRAEACGFHDPRLISQAMIEVLYPNAQHVHGSIWSAQQAGTLAMPDKTRLTARGLNRKLLDMEAYQKTTIALHKLGVALDEIKTEEPMPNTAVVLLETVLWTRYARSEEGVLTEVHVTNPDPDDLVIVTDEPVILAIEQGSLSLKEAVKLGIVRLYGTPEQKKVFLANVGNLGEQPLPNAELLSCGTCGCPYCSLQQTMKI